ncbi:MAG TPA: hypothetical protein VMP01_24490 [Pirellulaceae bacterium]|nr:hypothetical protein [Pirellulaceae bacterium]
MKVIANERRPAVKASAIIAPPWQFRLKHLFAAMTYAALASAFVAWCGPGTLMVTGGLGIAILNHCGAFTRLQSGRMQLTLLWGAWFVFLISLLLPALSVFGPIYGWGAAWYALTGPLAVVSEGGRIVDFALPWFLLMDLANLLAAALPLIIWRLAREGGQWLSAALCVAMVSTWFVVWDSGMLVGYFVWCGSFFLALVALPVRRWTLIAMLALAVIMGVIAEWNLLAQHLRLARLRASVPIAALASREAP